MALHTWLLYLVAALGLSLTPGPNSLLALTHGALHGHQRTLYTVAGGALGKVANSAGNKISPPPPTMASTKPASSEASVITIHSIGGLWHLLAIFLTA